MSRGDRGNGWNLEFREGTAIADVVVRLKIHWMSRGLDRRQMKGEGKRGS